MAIGVDSRPKSDEHNNPDPVSHTLLNAQQDGNLGCLEKLSCAAADYILRGVHAGSWSRVCLLFLVVDDVFPLILKPANPFNRSLCLPFQRLLTCCGSL